LIGEGGTTRTEREAERELERERRWREAPDITIDEPPSDANGVK
jgi:hypothetical protein